MKVNYDRGVDGRISEVHNTTRYGRLNREEKKRLEQQLGLICDRGTICSGMKGLVEDQIVGWVEELRVEYPNTYKSHATCRVHAVKLAKRIMSVLGKRLAMAKAVKAKKGKAL